MTCRTQAQARVSEHPNILTLVEDEDFIYILRELWHPPVFNSRSPGWVCRTSAIGEEASAAVAVYNRLVHKQGMLLPHLQTCWLAATGAWLQDCAFATSVVMLSGSRIALVMLRSGWLGGFEDSETCKTGQHISTRAGRIQNLARVGFVQTCRQHDGRKRRQTLYVPQSRTARFE
ncbi:TPA: hypothetical protein ACH3X1_000728 [Trebouxia sp. C0004]